MRTPGPWEERPCCTIRFEEPEDVAAVHRVNVSAFGQPNEADLVDALRRSGALTISLVAVEDGNVIGHIAFSPVTVESSDSQTDALGLGPMAVLPERQGTGIGSRLVEEGLRKCEKLKCEIVVVLGHPDYYPRFGFESTKQHGIQWEREVPDNVFMVKELRKGALSEISGVVRYRPEFDVV